jgi:LacI family transcriptional regulator
MDNGIPYKNEYVFIKDLTEKSGIETALQVMKMNPMPDGAFITNDFSAAVFMHTLKENGIRVPEDIAIVGFNNDAICKIVDPQLTTIDYPGVKIGEIVARNLTNHLKGISEIESTNTIVVRSELIVRKSSVRSSTHVAAANA